jgi:hypothetical protein
MERGSAGMGHTGEGSISGVKHSVTDVGEPALVRAPTVEITRGTVLAGRYQIEAEIGKGGSGVVLRAFDRVVEELVAVKILRADLAQDPKWVERFSRELRLGRQLQHPNVCRIFDIGEADGHRFLTIELATQGTLRDGIGDTTRSLELRLADARALLSGLAAIHAAGIVHRDVKPENLLRMSDGRLALSDFGLATNPGDAPATTIMVGTPSYMAPEIAIGAPATTRSDVWAAGVTLYEILFGTRPERKKLNDPNTQTFVPPGHLSRVEKALAYVARRCLAEDPKDRPADGVALKRLFDAAVTSPLRFAYRRRTAAFRGWGVIALAVLVAAVALRHRLWSPATANSAAHSAGLVVATGRPKDWRDSSKVIADLDGEVHCFMLLPGLTKARVVWGSPRRAEDIDIATGARQAAPLLPETYKIDCPQLSPKGDSLLFTRAVGQEPPQIMLGSMNGSAAKPVMSGTEPRWMPSGEEFLFNLDASHIAVFSLPTSNFSLLAEGRSDAKSYVFEKAVDAAGKHVAAMYVDGDSHWLTVHSLPSLEVTARWRLSRDLSKIVFDGDSLILSDGSDLPSLARLDWQSGSLVRLGALAGAEVSSLVVGSNELLLLAGKRLSDIWVFDARNPSGMQLTNDGVSEGASRSRSGDVLVQRHLADGRDVIVRYGRDGKIVQLTDGPSDCRPAYSSDGSRWFYADYARKTIRSCDSAGCKDLVKHSLVPAWPVSAPDDRHVAFVTAAGTTRLHIVDTRGEGDRDLGPTAIECPPVWTAPDRIWGFAGAGNSRQWLEIDTVTGEKTGRAKLAKTFDPDTRACGWESEAPGSPFFQEVRSIMRQTSQLRTLRRSGRGN